MALSELIQVSWTISTATKNDPGTSQVTERILIRKRLLLPGGNNHPHLEQLVAQHSLHEAFAVVQLGQYFQNVQAVLLFLQQQLHARVVVDLSNSLQLQLHRELIAW